MGRLIPEQSDDYLRTAREIVYEIQDSFTHALRNGDSRISEGVTVQVITKSMQEVGYTERAIDRQFDLWIFANSKALPQEILLGHSWRQQAISMPSRIGTVKELKWIIQDLKGLGRLLGLVTTASLDAFLNWEVFFPRVARVLLRLGIKVVGGGSNDVLGCLPPRLRGGTVSGYSQS